ncbi:MAG: TetR/AcrR family transcriptional regulator [Labilithrix sp.]|nr:TetR/AcrR family transcriptional regulator [Labilithrix sp.]
MTRKTKNAPRNPPRQARSQATVSAIFDATTRILDREGAEAATTTRIAAVAGVSIGTLYQYFADRDAILDALQEREFDRALALMSDVLSDRHLARSPRATVTAVVRGLGELYAACPGLQRALAIDALSTTHGGPKPARVEAFDMRIIAIVRHFLGAMHATARRSNVEAAAFVVHHAVRAVMLARLLERPAGLDEKALEAELVDLVLRYLVEEPRAVKRRAR